VTRPEPSKHPVPVGSFKIGAVPIVVKADPGLVVSKAQAAEIARRVATAFEWDKAQLGDTRTVVAPITIQVTPAMERGGGLTYNKELFQLNDAVLKSPDDNTIAHELSHMWDVRHASNAFSAVPSYLQEGRAMLLGDLYDREHGIDDTWMKVERQTLSEDARLKPEFVKEVLSPGFGGKKDAAISYTGELVGELFVEFLRTRLKTPARDAAGVADTVLRLGALTKSVGAGKKFGATFKSEFGVTVAEAQRQFMKYLEKTKSNPTERFRGTIFEQPAAPAPVRATADSFQAA
jgi:hypothetical protein